MTSSASTTRATVLLVTTCWWPSVARFAQLLARSDCGVHLLCPQGHPGVIAPGVVIHRQKGFRRMQALSRAIASSRPMMVIPADERAVADLHRMHRDGSDAERALVEASLGDPRYFPITLSRTQLLGVAYAAGLPVAEYAIIDTQQALDGWLDTHGYPCVLKTDGAWGGMGVRITPNRTESQAALAQFADHRGWFVALKRMVVNRDPFWFADLVQRGDGVRLNRVSAQAFIAGTPATIAMFCRNGRVLAASAAETVSQSGRTGPSTVIRLIDHPRMRLIAERLAERLGLNGFHGLDFMIDAAGRECLIELNPRLTAMGNIRVDQPSRDLLGTIVHLLGGNAAAVPLHPVGSVVAHVPFAWTSTAGQNAPDSADAPELIAEWLRESWPDRVPLARLSRFVSRLLGRAKEGQGSALDPSCGARLRVTGSKTPDPAY